MPDPSQSEVILPPHIEETVKAIATLHAEHQRRATPVQRVVDRSVRTIGRPRFVAILTGMILGWMLLNAVLGVYGREFGGPPYSLLTNLVRRSASTSRC